MSKKHESKLSTDGYLVTEGRGRNIIRLKAGQVLSSQGDRAESVFYLQTGRAKLTVVSKVGEKPRLRCSLGGLLP
jgi:CRP-like cAMP-binding protein